MTRDGAALTGAGNGDQRPPAVGQKFDADGAVLRFPGNTFLCHVPPGGKAHAALCEASLALQAGPLAAAFSFLPPSSFHMTVFEGVTDAHRGDARWPEGMPADLGLSEVTTRFAAAVDPLALPARQRVRPLGLSGGRSLAVAGATPDHEASLRESRRVLREATGIRRPDFASYGFHVTLAYQLRWLTEAEAAQVMDLSDRVFAQLCKAAPEIDLGRIEFCVFDNMHAFHPIRLLGAA
jgi:hypothetical protein